MRSNPAPKWIALASAIFLAAGWLPAQTYLVPKSLGGQPANQVEGGSGELFPFARSKPLRMQCIYNSEELPFTGPTFLQEVVLRADNTVPNQAQAAKSFVRTALSLSTSTVRAESANPVFEDNHGPDWTYVIKDSGISNYFNLPAQPPMAAGPRPYNVPFPFEHPVFFDLSPVRGEELASSMVVDFQIYQQPSGLYRMDSPFGCRSTITSYGVQGAGCVSSTSPPQALQLDLAGQLSVLAGGNMTYRLQHAHPNVAAVLAMGVGLLDPADAIPLLSGCSLVVNPVLLRQFATTDPTGTAFFPLPVPPLRALVGETVHAQAAAFDPAANGMLLVTSGGLSTSICGPLGVCRVAVEMQTADDHDTVLSGQSLFGTSLMLEFR